jgi:adenylate cyclase
MGIEIERKFLVINDEWKRGNPRSHRFKQGYITRDATTIIRVRLTGERAFLTLKKKMKGLSRWEYEYEIPVGDAVEMLNNLCISPFIEKMRYLVPCTGHVWEVDVFEGQNKGLILAEVELKDEKEEIISPPWLGTEVTGDSRYLNINLVKHPFKSWV